MRWGDDYALLFTATSEANLPKEVIRIGEVIPLTDWPLLLDGSEPDNPEDLGYLHSNP